MDDSTLLTVRWHPSLGQSRGFWERPGLFGGGDDLLRAAGSALRPDHERIWSGLLLRHRALARPAAEPERWLLLHTGRTEHSHRRIQAFNSPWLSEVTRLTSLLLRTPWWPSRLWLSTALPPTVRRAALQWRWRLWEAWTKSSRWIRGPGCCTRRRGWARSQESTPSEPRDRAACWHRYDPETRHVRQGIKSKRTSAVRSRPFVSWQTCKQRFHSSRSSMALALLAVFHIYTTIFIYLFIYIRLLTFCIYSLIVKIF